MTKPYNLYNLHNQWKKNNGLTSKWKKLTLAKKNDFDVGSSNWNTNLNVKIEREVSKDEEREG